MRTPAERHTEAQAEPQAKLQAGLKAIPQAWKQADHPQVGHPQVELPQLQHQQAGQVHATHLQVGQPQAAPSGFGCAILAAALALPGVALADTAPEKGQIAFKYLDYQDRQPGMDRVKVHAPAVSLLLPLAGDWSLEAGLMLDSLSGASPRYHTAISGASNMEDERRAADLKVTRHLPRGSVSLGASWSNENDYRSRALSVQGTFSSEDKNSTWLAGIGVANDNINPVNQLVRHEGKHTVDFLFGLTQVFSQNDIAQFNLSHARGEGYFSDPYKSLDRRPRERNQTALLARWNHHFSATGGTGQFSYRWYRDSFGVRAHTFGSDYVQPMPDGWTLTPGLRLYSQGAAWFYFDPVYDKRFGEPFPPGFQFGAKLPSSADQRLSAFGAATVSFKLAKRFAKDWTFDIKLERYEQRAAWRWFGNGSPGLAPFKARMVQIGLARQW